jgi:glycosyltransferase involved in cell wall biosynthesis
MDKLSLTVILITLNEEYHLAEVLDNLSDIAENIFIVDSLSSDRTVDIALEKGVTIVQRPFTNFGDQWNFALKNNPFDTEWVMKIDPDERLSEKLKSEIRRTVKLNNSKTAYEFHRRLWFMGKPMHVLNNVLRLWKKNKCRFSDVLVNEHPIIDGSIGFLKGKMEHFDSKDLHHWQEKQNKYSTMEAKMRYEKKALAADPNIFGNKLEKRMFVKKILFKVPFKFTILFLYNFFITGAWRDGKLGWRWAQLRVYVYRMRQLKFIEMQTLKTKIK